MRKKWELGLNEIEDGGWGGGYEVLEVLGRMNKVLSWFLVSYFLICYLLLVFVLIWCLCLIVGSLSCLFLLFVHALSWSCGAGSLAFSCCILVLLIWIENQVISSVFACTPILYLFHTHWCLSKKNNNNNSEMFDMCLGLAQSNDDIFCSKFDNDHNTCYRTLCFLMLVTRMLSMIGRGSFQRQVSCIWKLQKHWYFLYFLWHAFDIYIFFMQKCSKINVDNRNKLKYNHRGGS